MGTPPAVEKRKIGVHVSLDLDTLGRLDAAATRVGVSRSQLLRRMIEEWTEDEEAAEWLIANDVQVVTTLDGPASVHDWNRQWIRGSAHADVVRWIDYFKRRYVEVGRDPQQWHCPHP